MALFQTKDSENVLFLMDLCWLEIQLDRLILLCWKVYDTLYNSAGWLEKLGQSLCLEVQIKNLSSSTSRSVKADWNQKYPPHLKFRPDGLLSKMMKLALNHPKLAARQLFDMVLRR